ncbi:NlpC/P60 family protein [Modestobacter sp. I12A-02628]|uniref:C40 family peptidase n=1 Tax=Goekera deserti TaxID=2497753 RepID=A0A7K3W9U8_9ACTN|nr:C40 family peptidase [Goekera deserti]MPQ98811.1 NlpC/P60 family protein [Goekera deserti]NDI49691.1 NlpC/P60 family protein [Goekera deserti]NEL53116.1 C40 family peptidase [Goekera deserti]
MASPCTSALGRVHPGRRALITVVGALCVALAPLPALAAPTEEPTSSAEAAALIAARGHDLEVLTEEFNTARETLLTDQAAAAAAAAAVTDAQAALTAAQGQVVDVARSAYTGNQLSSLEAMLTSDSADQLVDRVGTLETIADHSNSVLGTAQAANEAAAAAEKAASETAAAAADQVERVAAQQADLQSQIAEYQADYDRLSAEEKAAALAAAAAAHAAEQEAAASASASSSSATSSGSSSASSSGGGSSTPAPAPSTPIVASSGAAQTAVDTAMAQRGKPYVWAASGPGSYDCSGLMQYAYKAAGISLPHSSAMQSRMGQAVSRADLRPGDMIFFYSPVSHVGMYIGNGQMVHAPTSGDVVKVASIDVMGSITAMRRLAG